MVEEVWNPRPANPMMKRFNFHPILSLTLVIITTFASPSLRAEFPTAQEIADEMTVGWNLGNTLEAMCSETAWGGAKTTQKLIDKVKESGFNAVRIPCAWDCHSKDGVIDSEWIARVREVVDYCLNDNLYVILNMHWDGGWLENNVTPEAEERVNAKQAIYWKKIAEYFKDYDEHLLFAGTNEPNVEDAEGMAVLMTYLQTFVDTVRSTGGNNSSRTLVVQGPSTDIKKTNELMNALPKDTIDNRLILEIHYYTPYQFCIMDKDADWGKMFYYWGKDNHSTTDPERNATWGEEEDVERLFGLMKTKFVDQGIPVIVGEFAVGRRRLRGEANQQLHDASREYFYKYVVGSIVEKGMIPFCWDTNMQLFNRGSGKILDQGVIDAIMSGAGVPDRGQDK